MTCYYNEIDPYAAQWLRNLIKEQLIADGDVDERSIEDVRPDDLRGYTQCHFFAGIGVWSYALRNAGWSDDRPVWTGSCPCFPAGTLITTSKGQVPIERVSAGDLVLTDKGRFMPVVRTGCDERKPLVKLRGQGHWGLVSTPNHPFLSRSQRRRGHAGRIELGEVEWVDASDMCGRRWAMPTSVETTLRVDSDRAFAKFAGFFVGNGWTSEDGHIFLCDSFDKSDEVDRVARGSGVSGKGCNERTAYRWRGRDCDLARWLNTEFGKGATNKQIPSWVFGAPVEWREAFLEGWLQADGHKQSLTTASRALAVSGRILLNTLGYAASVRWVDGRGVTVIEGREVADRGYYRLQFCENPKSFKFDTHGWGLVRSVEAAGFGTVFNMEVEDDNTYVADGIIVHNCQPFSSAGKGNGTADERHLWPAWYHLIRQCKPDVIFGEQVEAAIRHSWLDHVQTDLEGSGYTLGAVGLPAAGFGAPHIRQRLFFVADAVDIRQFKQWDSTTAALQGCGTERSGEYEEPGLTGFVSRGSQGLGCTGELDHHHHQGLEGLGSGHQAESGWEGAVRPVAETGELGELADASDKRRDRLDTCVCRRGSQQTGIEDDGHCKTVQHGRFLSARELANIPYEGRYVDPSRNPGPTNGHWRDVDWLFCRDGKWRPVVATHVSLVDGPASDVVRVRTDQNSERSETKKEGVTHVELPVLRDKVGTEAIQRRGVGTTVASQAEKVLQQGVHGKRDAQGSMQQCEPQQDESRSDCEELLRSMWCEGEVACAPHRPQSTQQRCQELEDVVSCLPSSLSLAKLHGDRRTQSELHALQQAIYQAGGVLHSSQSVQEVWASLSQETKDWVRVGFDASRWQKLVAFPLEKGVCNRVGRLRAYGNAIVAPVAEEFIRAYMSCNPA